jgi:ApbE superfamily uncharacterized protein (UPF0280 family)
LGMGVSDMYEERFYREWSQNEALERFEVKIDESDLFILSDVRDEEKAVAALKKTRTNIETTIERHPVFASSLEPLDVLDGAPDIVFRMIEAGRFWEVGPMAAVAGAVAEQVGLALLERASTVIVENGGDIFASAGRPLRFALYAGEASPFAGELAFELDASGGIGVCTSSGTVGPSLSFGQADAVVAIHSNPLFADAAATAIANRIQGPEDIQTVVETERQRGALKGLIACCRDQLGLFGDLELMKR